MASLENLGPDTWRDFLASDRAVLVLGKSDCQACKDWSAELETWLESGEAPEDLRFGKLLLDQRGLLDFKKANPWLAEVTVLPYTIVYSGGERFKEFAGGGLDRLQTRLQRLSA